MNKPYRNEVDALRERKVTLENELAKLREEADALAAIEKRRAELVGELASVEAKLGARVRTKLPMLDQVKVASPCNAEWNDMVGDDRVRFCLKCDKNVFNLSAMNSADAEALIAERAGGELCVRYYQRADGTIMTQDCPVGVTKKRRKKAALAIAGAGAMAAAAYATMMPVGAECPTGGARMGEVAVETLESPSMQQAPMVQGSFSPPVPDPPIRKMGRMKMIK
jgi:hypothetical protein